MDKNIKKRLSISVSFSSGERELYDYVYNLPNTSYYIKDLIKKDMEEKITKNTDKNMKDIFEVEELAMGVLDW